MDKVSKYRIMLVDDELKVLSALKRSLNNKNYQIEAFEYPKDAIDYAKTQTIDLIITDYRMPEINGVSLLMALKELQPNMIMIMLSGYVDMPAVLTAINEVGIYKYLTKPWKDEELKQIIAEVLSSVKKTSLSDSDKNTKTLKTQPSSALALLESKYPGITKGVCDPQLDKFNKI